MSWANSAREKHIRTTEVPPSWAFQCSALLTHCSCNIRGRHSALTPALLTSFYGFNPNGLFRLLGFLCLYFFYSTFFILFISFSLCFLSFSHVHSFSFILFIGFFLAFFLFIFLSATFAGYWTDLLYGYSMTSRSSPRAFFLSKWHVTTLDA